MDENYPIMDALRRWRKKKIQPKGDDEVESSSKDVNINLKISVENDKNNNDRSVIPSPSE